MCLSCFIYSCNAGPACVVQLVSDRFTSTRLLPYGDDYSSAARIEFMTQFWNDWPPVASDYIDLEDDRNTPASLASGLTMAIVLPRYLYATTQSVRHFSATADMIASRGLTTLLTSAQVAVSLPPLSALLQFERMFVSQSESVVELIRTFFRSCVFPFTVFIAAYLGLPPFPTCFEFYRRCTDPVSRLLSLISCVAMLWQRGYLADPAMEVCE